MATKFNITSLGCAKNRVDTEVMMGLLRSAGYDLAHREEDAEVLIVNTCGFILPAKEESINRILELAALKQSGACRALLVAGCLSQGYSSELADELSEVDIFLGPGEVPQIADLVAKALAGNKFVEVGKPDYLYDHNTPRMLTTPFHYGYLKVADGCDNFCSYCAIPSLRGNFRSRSEESILAEAQNLVQRGVQEILLIAQDTTRYGFDRYGEDRLPQLLHKFREVEDLQWLRLMYCYPDHITPQLIEAMAKDPKICKYIDLPLQHGDDYILQAMNRRGSKQEIKKLVQSLRENIPGIAIRSTFIVGFPGEEESHFQNLLEFMEEMRFDRVGVFTYSQEERTPAGQRLDQVPEEVKEERFHRAMALQQEISLSVQKEWIGKTVKVLIEEEVEQGLYRGRSEREAPEVDGFIEFSGKDLMPGQWATVKIKAAGHYDLMGEALDESGQ
ncbi:30S ribosomal protein S12 methylthiotransferase RimO [Heliorestis acidaminivorans]|uniref:Ribosomal protein uS12 methylthiotransferase RimO n=1 Tax=Heliorestis acidaminivorans TaxID=553427 RepID=A0A6I0F591_9FIRM|nr:30S ribosomal protein S12 methylthiotransferase RimO [Heliorestis acidaminivorans]KAB2954162.1 30S ribosomal protein S12 methylthiotransferase RimO [Heliorestis acidaminivorans]